MSQKNKPCQCTLGHKTNGGRPCAYPLVFVSWIVTCCEHEDILCTRIYVGQANESNDCVDVPFMMCKMYPMYEGTWKPTQVPSAPPCADCPYAQNITRSPRVNKVRLLKHIELLARSEDAAPLASLRPSKSASPAFPEALEFAIRGRSGTAPAFETAAPAKHSIWQSKLRSHILRELELENDCTMSNSICALVLANLPIN